MKEERRKARVWAKENISEYGEKISINNHPVIILTYCRSDIKSITGKSHEDGVDLCKQIPNLPEILKIAVYIGSSPDYGSHNEVYFWHYYVFLLHDKPNYFNIMETKKGEFRINSVSDEKGFDRGKIKNKV